MAFVFSFWYIIALILVAGIVASVVVFLKMDKKDKVLIEEFIKQNQPAEETAEPVVETESKE
ncbi:MAG: hypothetical protein J6Q13_00860 [Clostridia bacterium]|nr:hypothetical protein [Clostridia bacterium]